MWFERLMGFAEESPAEVRANIEHDAEILISRVNGRRVRCGRLTIPSLAELRQQQTGGQHGTHATVTAVVGDVRLLHEDTTNAGALFQAASRRSMVPHSQ